MNIGLLGFRLYDHHLGDYMRRWVLQTPVGFVRLHNIRQPDADEVLHDHPWHFVALILKGGYTEVRPIPGGCPAWGPFQELRYDAGSLNFCRADGVHRITEIHGSCWTLVLSSRRVRGFGFWKKSDRANHSAEFVPWQKWVSVAEKEWTADDYDQRLRDVGATE